MFDSLLSLLAAVISGGLLQTGISYLLKKREQKRADFDIIVETYSSDNRRLREDAKEKDSRITKLNQKLINAYSIHNIHEENNEQSPVPSWVKSKNGIMLWMNNAYEKHFLTPHGFSKSDYRLNKDDKIWPQETAEMFHKSDQHVLNTGKTIFIEQTFPVAGDIQTWLVIKYAFNNRKGIKGIGGFCIPNARLLDET